MHVTILLSTDGQTGRLPLHIIIIYFLWLSSLSLHYWASIRIIPSHETHTFSYGQNPSVLCHTACQIAEADHNKQKLKNSDAHCVAHGREQNMSQNGKVPHTLNPTMIRFHLEGIGFSNPLQRLRWSVGIFENLHWEAW